MYAASVTSSIRPIEVREVPRVCLLEKYQGRTTAARKSPSLASFIGCIFSADWAEMKMRT